MDVQPPGELPGDLPSGRRSLPPDVVAEVPGHLDVLPDGREAVVFGDVERFTDYGHRQGDNPFGFQGTCGLCSCECVLRQFDIEITEADLVAHAIARGLCVADGRPEMCGATSVGDQIRILSDFGVPAYQERAGSLEDLAADLEQGRGVIILLDAGTLWDDPNHYEGRANHAITPIGVARDPADGSIHGFYVNDSGTGDRGRFVDSAVMEAAWLQTGGSRVITDRVHIESDQRGTT